MNCLARFSSCLSANHWKARIHLIGYLEATKERQLILQQQPDLGRPVECFVNANWGVQTQDHHTVCCFTFTDALSCGSLDDLLLWLSTFQVEYMALGHPTRHGLWIRHLLAYIGVNFRVRFLCNNQSVVKIGCQEASNKRTHYVEREFSVTNQAIYEDFPRMDSWERTTSRCAYQSTG